MSDLAFAGVVAITFIACICKLSDNRWKAAYQYLREEQRRSNQAYEKVYNEVIHLRALAKSEEWSEAEDLPPVGEILDVLLSGSSVVHDVVYTGAHTWIVQGAPIERIIGVTHWRLSTKKVTTGEAL